MNQVTAKSAFDQPKDKSSLNEADVESLRDTLVEGEKALARQQDIIELHKRVLSMFSKLDGNLTERLEKQAAEDRAFLSAKTDEMAHAINGMEAAFRIEMAPTIEAMIKSALAEKTSQRRSVIKSLFWLSILSAAGIVLGAFYADGIAENLSKLSLEIWKK